MNHSCYNKAVAAAVACALTASVLTPRIASAQEAASHASDTEISEVIITGSYIKRPADRPQPLTVLNADALEDTQRNSLAESLKDLPQNVGSMAVVNTQGGGVDAGNSPTTTVNLRGLGAGATLVLVNSGRQVADGGYGYVDINNVAPSIMIDRVETVTDGSSALYGSDAVAGVINVITKKNFTGFEVKGDLQRIQDTTYGRPDMNFGLLWGAHNDTTSVVAGLEYQTTQTLYTDDRYSADRLKFGLSSGFGNPASFQGIVNNGIGAQPAATASSMADPLCGSSLLGNGGPSGLANGTVTTTGTPSCQLYNALGRSLQPNSQRINSLTTITHKFSDAVTGEFEVGFARTRYSIPFGYVTPATTTPGLFPQVPLDNPGVLATEAMFPTFANKITTAGYSQLLFKGRVLAPYIDNGADGDIRHTGQDTWRVSGKLNGKFGDTNWDWEVGFNASWNTTFFQGHDTYIQRVQLAVNGYGGAQCAYNPTNDPTGAHRGTGSCQFWNPFAIAALAKPGDADYNDPSLTNWLVGMRSTNDIGQLRTYHAVTTGKLWDMPGGTTGIAVGFERRDLNFAQQWDGCSEQVGCWGFNNATFADVDFAGSSSTNAGFVELAMYPAKAWEVQLAGRYENTSYADAGSFGKFNPKLSVLWTPIKSLFVRASAGTSFQAPGPASMFAENTGGASTDRIGGDVINARGFLVGNPNLKPETSKNWNVGVTWDVTKDFTVDVNYWDIRFKDIITSQNAEAILTANLAQTGGYITSPQIVLASGAPNHVCEYALNGVTPTWTPASGIPRPADCMSGNDILQFNTTYVNQGYLYTNGIDYDLKYRLEKTGWNALDQFGLQYSLRVYGTFTTLYQMSQAGVVYDGVGKYNDSTFGVAMPHYTVNTQLGVTRGAQSLMATVRYIPPMTLQVPGTSNAGTQSFSFTTLDLLYRYQLPWGKGSSVTAAIMNVTNADDPIAGGSQITTFGNVYNFLGRVFRLGFDYKF